MTEQKVQANKIKELEAEGYYVLKLIKTNKNGIPDLLALHPEKEILFVEVKTKKGRVSKLQEYRIKEYGFQAEVHRGVIASSVSSVFI